MIKPLDFAGEFEPAFIDGVKEIFEDKIVFNRVLGLRITELRPTTVKARIEMRNDLIGHYAHNRIHGGVISAGLDASTVTPGSTAPVSSLTMPMNALCARATPGNSVSTVSARNSAPRTRALLIPLTSRNNPVQLRPIPGGSPGADPPSTTQPVLAVGYLAGVRTRHLLIVYNQE